MNTVSSASPLVRLGKFTLALGSMSVVRLITEAISEGFSYSRIQANIMGIDFLLALGTIASGIGLLRNARWASSWAASAASTQFVWYLAWLVLWGPSMLMSPRSFEWRILGPRLLFCVLSIAFWPYVAWALFGSAKRTPEPGSSLLGRFVVGLSLAVSAVIGLFVFVIVVFID